MEVLLGIFLILFCVCFFFFVFAQFLILILSDQEEKNLFIIIQNDFKRVRNHLQRELEKLLGGKG